jgi:hypothetical protein
VKQTKNQEEGVQQQFVIRGCCDEHNITDVVGERGDIDEYHDKCRGRWQKSVGKNVFKLANVRLVLMEEDGCKYSEILRGRPLTESF